MVKRVIAISQTKLLDTKVVVANVSSDSLAFSLPFHDIVADNGCTCHFLLNNSLYANKPVANPPIGVLLPSGNIMTSTHSADLDIGNTILPIAAR
jgi:hypothetical protein